MSQKRVRGIPLEDNLKSHKLYFPVFLIRKGMFCEMYFYDKTW